MTTAHTPARTPEHEPTDKERLEKLETAEKVRYQVTPDTSFPARLILKENQPGPLTGKPLAEARVAGENYFAERYIGIGPLVIKTARGEIKALSGDIIVYFDNPTDKEKPQYLHVIPSEVAELLGIELPEPPEEELPPPEGTGTQRVASGLSPGARPSAPATSRPSTK